jgi:hypothetical protein
MAAAGERIKTERNLPGKKGGHFFFVIMAPLVFEKSNKSA